MIARLDDFIVERAIHAFSASVPVCLWRNETIAKERLRQFTYRMTTAFCLEVVLEQVYDYAARRLASGERISCVLEANQHTQAEAERAYRNFVVSKPGWVAAFAERLFVSGKGSREALGLQAADAVAYESSRALKDWIVGPRRHLRPLLRRLKARGRVDGIMYDQQGMVRRTHLSTPYRGDRPAVRARYSDRLF